MKIRPSLKVITGPMFCGKTTELIKFIRKDKLAGINIVIFSPKCDVRSGEGNIMANTKDLKEKSMTIDEKTPEKMLLYLKKHPEIDAVAIDEAQFFSKELEDIVKQILLSNRKVYVAGLKADSNEQPFGPINNLMVWADDVIMLKSICKLCGSDDAAISASMESKTSQVKVGGAESYFAICRACRISEQQRKFNSITYKKKKD